MTWTSDDIRPQTGRRVVITGGDVGLGFQVAVGLARRGAEIVLPARAEAEAAEAGARIMATAPGARVIPATLDLASLASIRAFAEGFGGRFPGPSLDLLIHTAAAVAPPRRELTVDSLERQFAANCLGPFLLTALLFRHLKPLAGARVVTLAGEVPRDATIDFDNLQSERRYAPPDRAHPQSRLARLVFLVELQRRLAAARSPIASVGVDPGPADGRASGILAGLLRRVTHLPAPPASRAALPVLYAAAAPEATPGGYYRAGEDGGAPVPARVPAAARYTVIAARLWTESEQLTGISFDVGRDVARWSADPIGD